MIRQGFDAGSYVHPIAVDVAIFGDDVPHVDSDPELNADVWRRGLFAVRHRALDFRSALHGIHRAGELGEQPVTRAFNNAAVVLLDARIDELAAVRLLAGEGAGLVRTHQAGVPDHVQSEYGGEPAFHPFPPRGVGWTNSAQKRGRGE